MKKIFLLIALFGALSCSTTLDRTAIQSLSGSHHIGLPYGDKGVLYEFPQGWSSSDRDPEKYPLYSDLGILYEEIHNRRRKWLAFYYSQLKPLLARGFVPSKAMRSRQEKIQARSARVYSVGNLDVLSIIYEGQIDCETCEYPESQTHNVLASIRDRKLVDKLLISYQEGSDLDRITRHFYIDKDSLIHLKDFVGDETDVYYLQYLKYKMNDEGKFIRQ